MPNARSREVLKSAASEMPPVPKPESRLPSVLYRTTRKVPAAPPATAILPFDRISKSKPSSAPPDTSVVATPPVPKEESRVPLPSSRKTRYSAVPDTLAKPATTIFPSDWMLTFRPACDCPVTASAVTIPPDPNDVSRVPLAFIRTTAISPDSLEMLAEPTTTIFPSVCKAIPFPKSFPALGLTTTLPLPSDPNAVSTVPSALSRLTRISHAPGQHLLPATTIFPSG